MREEGLHDAPIISSSFGRLKLVNLCVSFVSLIREIESHMGCGFLFILRVPAESFAGSLHVFGSA